MSEGISLDDAAITRPEQDRYGFNPFARALARGVSGMTAPEGMVVAVTGPWGSGKSGVINLVLHHLQTEVDAGRLAPVRFSPWWFGSGETLLRAFFEALRAAMGGALRGKAKKVATEAVNAIYQKVRPVKPILAVGGDVAAGGNPVGSAAVALGDFAVDRLNAGRLVEKEYERLAEALRGQARRLLVVVDDIDRLEADQAEMVFRLVKSVGRLPNVVYLIAYDRGIADRQLGQRFGEVATRYLQKVVQVSYELPVPARPLLRRAFLDDLEGIVGEEPIRDATRFGNVLHDCVAPWLATPRDVVLLANALRVGWPAVAGEVDVADFVALEAIRVAFPDVHRAVRDNPQALCGVPSPDLARRRGDDGPSRHDTMLLASVPETRREEMRVALRRLFPRLDSVYANVWHGSESARDWRRGRLAAARDRFDAYFMLSPGEGAVSARDLDDLFGRLADPAQVQAAFRDAVTIHRTADNVTRAALLLDELRLRAEDVAEEVIPVLLAALSAIADDLDVPEDDQVRGWGNQLRLWGLLQDLTTRRMDQGQRSALLLGLAGAAQPRWLVWMAESAWHEHQTPGEGENPREREPLVTSEAAQALREASLEAIRQAARIGALIRHRRLDHLLEAWAVFADDGGAQVRHWTAAHLAEDGSVVLLADAATFMGESFGLGGFGFLGNRVSTRTPTVNRAAVSRFCDADRLVARVEQLLAGQVAAADRAVLERFMEGWRNTRAGGGSREGE